MSGLQNINNFFPKKCFHSVTTRTIDAYVIMGQHAAETDLHIAVQSVQEEAWAHDLIKAIPREYLWHRFLRMPTLPSFRSPSRYRTLCSLQLWPYLYAEVQSCYLPGTSGERKRKIGGWIVYKIPLTCTELWQIVWDYYNMMARKIFRKL